MADATRDLNAAQQIAEYYTNLQYIMLFKQFFKGRFIEDKYVQTVDCT